MSNRSADFFCCQQNPPKPFTQAILSHYNSNADCTIEGPELYAFVGDIARHLGLKLSLPVIEAGLKRVKVGFTGLYGEV